MKSLVALLSLGLLVVGLSGGVVRAAEEEEPEMPEALVKAVQEIRDLGEKIWKAREAGNDEERQELLGKMGELRRDLNRLVRDLSVDAMLPPDARKELIRLRAALAEAREAGDEEAARDLRDQIAKLLREHGVRTGNEWRERMADRRRLGRELREAREAGDEAKVKELEEQRARLRRQRTEGLRQRLPAGKQEEFDALDKEMQEARDANDREKMREAGRKLGQFLRENLPEDVFRGRGMDRRGGACRRGGRRGR